MIERTNSRCCSKPPRTPKDCYPSAHAHLKSIRSPRFKKAGLAIAYLCLSLSQGSSQGIEYRSLPELLDHGSQALALGDFPAAAQAFNSIRENYREEPIWLEGELPAKILPLAGFASHKSNQQSQAIAALESYLANYSENQSYDIFVRYTLASSLLLDGQKEAAKKAFSELRSLAGDSPFRDLASLREAELSQPLRAIELLTQVVKAPTSARLASFARLRLIQLHLKQDDIHNARIQLLSTPWISAAMPERATLSSLATQVADKLIAQHPAFALQAYRLVSPKKQLVSAQQTRIAELQQSYQQLTPKLRTEQSMWSEQFRQSIEQLRTQLKSLVDGPSYSEAINLRKARCFAQINRPIEAWILLEPIATSHHPLARDAHMEWISVARSMHAWNAAANLAQDFIKKYPDDNDIPQILFWIALAQVEQKNFQKAISSLQSVTDRSPAKQLTAAAHYYQGFCYYNLGNTSAAINAFQKSQTTNPHAPVASQALLWIGICEFTTNKLEQATATFQSIQKSEHASFLHPEASYREIACYYALGELERALTLTKTWINKYPSHTRLAEVRLLKGDVLTEQNKLTLAIETYAQVESNDPQTHFIGIQKQATLLIETKKTEEAREVLENYRRSEPVGPKFIGSFTTLLASCLPAIDSQKEIERTVHAYGNDLESIGITELITQLTSPPIPSKHQPTLESRLLVASIYTDRLNGATTQAKLKGLELASKFDRNDLPPSALLEGGIALAEIGSLDAPRYFNRITNEYPNSKYIDSSHTELARYHTKQKNFELALAHLLQTPNSNTDSLSLKLELETKLSQRDNAKQTADLILSDRQALPKHKAQALTALGNIQRANGNAIDAYTYYQRIFTLYRGELEYVAQAYQSCIQILISENRLLDAQKVAAEFLAQADLESHLAYREIQKQTILPKKEKSSTYPSE